MILMNDPLGQFCRA